MMYGTDHCHQLEDRICKLEDEITRLRRIVGLLADFVREEAISACSPEPEELLVKCGLATWEKYEPNKHGHIDADPEPGDRVWITTDECRRFIGEANDAG